MSATTIAELDYRPSYLAAAIAGTLVLLLYLLTLAPSTAMWDTSEYLAAAYVLGIPHPPGNPLFVLIGRVFAVLPLPGTSVAVRINLLAALCSALSATMWFLITERVLVGWFTRRWQRIVGGALAALIGATAFTVWNQSVVNEKVYTVSLLGLAVIAWLTVRWSDDPDGPKADRLLVLIAYLSTLGYTNHMAGMLAVPAVAVAVLIRRPATLLRWRLLLVIAGVGLLGLTPFATQPIRAAHFPEINEGEPTGCATEFAWECTFSGQTLERFDYNVNRGQYGKPSVLERAVPFTAQVGMWWTYFRWQWLRDPGGAYYGAQLFLAVIFLTLGLLGGWVHWRRDPRSFAFFGPLMLTLTLGLIYYLNFKYGFSQATHLGDAVPREVRDRDYFYLWSFSAWSVWAALGLVAVWEWVAEAFGADEVKLGRDVVEQPRPRSWALASPVLAIALVPLVVNWSAASRAGERDTAAFARDLLNSVEPYGILVTAGDNDTFPLWYAQEVEGIRRDVVVANTSLLKTDWYVRQIIRAPVREYDASAGPELYRGREWPKPQGPPLRLSFDEANAVPDYVTVARPQIFRQGNIEARIAPYSADEPRFLLRDEILVLRMIRDSYPERPVYFSRTTGGYGEGLGLGPYLLTQGLAKKLLPDVPAPARDTLITPDGWLDVPTSSRLWTEVYRGPAALEERGDWIDQASVGIPMLYVATAGMLADALAQTGRLDQARAVMRDGRAVAEAVGIGRIFDESMLDSPAVLTPAGESAARP
jgi:hypothetical protein